MDTPPGVKKFFDGKQVKYHLKPYNVEICPYKGFEWSDLSLPTGYSPEKWTSLVDKQLTHLRNQGKLPRFLVLHQHFTDLYMEIMGIAKNGLPKEDFEKVKNNLHQIRLDGAKFGELWMTE